jgi:hypothetical protein
LYTRQSPGTPIASAYFNFAPEIGPELGAEI